MLRLLSIVVVLLTLVSFGVLRAQGAPSLALPTFHTVSIVPSVSGLIDIQYSPRTFTARTTSLVELIEQAYGVKTWEVFGGPDWVRTDRFTITATTTTAVPQERMKRMLQVLLTERFGLQLAPETQSVDLYRLTASDTSKLKRAKMPTARPFIDAGHIRNADAVSEWKGRNATMSHLVVALSQYLRAPVIDETRLTGAYDFRFEFADVSAFGRDDGDQREGRSIVKAMEKDLGLKLFTGKGPVSGRAIRSALKP